mgnify:CR=1 FL=1
MRFHRLQYTTFLDLCLPISLKKFNFLLKKHVTKRNMFHGINWYAFSS